MNLNFSPEDIAFRDEVRRFIAEKYTPEMRDQNAKATGMFADKALGLRWQKILHEKGWGAPSWPKEYGGTGWSPVQRFIWDIECGEADVPFLAVMGHQMCGPVIMRYGTKAQKEFFLPGILSGDIYFCQGYSEPGSGSDLASLKTRATRDGDHYVVNGTKIWTTHAHFANWIFMLVRTNPDAKPQAGITFLLARMDTPGITVQPIISASGEHDVNQVFFDDVRVPVENRIGEENDGWSVAKYLLEFERGGGTASGRMRSGLKRLKAVAKAESNGAGGNLWDDIGFRIRYAALEAEVDAIEGTELRVVSITASGKDIGDTMASMLKLTVSEATQRITELTFDALGYYGIPSQRDTLEVGSNVPPVGPDYGMGATARYLNNRAYSIFGGSNEIQRNILAKTALGI